MGVSRYFDDHDPRSKLDYTIKWSTWLGTDQVTGSSWVAAPENPDSAIWHHIGDDSFTTGSATIWLSSGTSSMTYRFENTIGTLGGREANDSIYITVKDL